ncbi:lipocalin family protein [Roseomonas frigidaquae]|uniref:Outer membrane lipoprotein Blc n=1 Tax=Falsiroseomonas frigidaquae TaxID=487318 RepID=A0ABX1F5E3_9PROT|nr:lipocalin family protein [Falsiroseomonas frigidaquae]NKE47548.1 lipocalin family protein [Falsiroseomonas frigidaquae]
MRRLLLLALLAPVLLLVNACATTPARAPVATVPQVDLARYAGTWFEIARFPNSFQDGGGRICTHTTATYTPRPDGTIGVVNRCRGADGAPRVAEGTAHVVPESGNAKLRVTFFWPFYGDYWVLGLDPSYRWAVVGAPGRDYLWVLARRPELAPGDYAEAVITAAMQGFEVSRLRPTPQE